MDDRDLELHAHRISAVEGAIGEMRTANVNALDRIMTKLDVLIRIEMKYEQLTKDVQENWRVTHTHDELIGALRDIPGMKASLYGNDGFSGVVGRMASVESLVVRQKADLDALTESVDERMEPVEMAIHGKSQDEPGLSTRIDRLEVDNRFFRRSLKFAAATVGAGLLWIFTIIGSKLKPILFGPGP